MDHNWVKRGPTTEDLYLLLQMQETSGSASNFKYATGAPRGKERKREECQKKPKSQFKDIYRNFKSESENK